MTQAELSELWKTRVDVYKASIQSTAEWYEAKQINRPQLWYWLRKFKESTKQQNASPQWVSVEVNHHTSQDPIVSPRKI